MTRWKAKGRAMQFTPVALRVHTEGDRAARGRWGAWSIFRAANAWSCAPGAMSKGRRSPGAARRPSAPARPPARVRTSMEWFVHSVHSAPRRVWTKNLNEINVSTVSTVVHSEKHVPRMKRPHETRPVVVCGGHPPPPYWVLPGLSRLRVVASPTPRCFKAVVRGLSCHAGARGRGG